MIKDKYLLFREGELIDIIDPIQGAAMVMTNKDDRMYFASSSKENSFWLHKLTDEKSNIVIATDFVICEEAEVPEEIKLKVLLLT